MSTLVLPRAFSTMWVNRTFEGIHLTGGDRPSIDIFGTRQKLEAEERPWCGPSGSLVLAPFIHKCGAPSSA